MPQTRTARIVRGVVIAGAVAIVWFTWATLPFVSAQEQPVPGTTRITVNGSSNLQAWTAGTTAVMVTRGGEGSLFEVSLRTIGLTSPKEGIDKNMHKALKAGEYPRITFVMTRLEPGEIGEGPYKAAGLLTVAGIEREVTLDLMAEREQGRLRVKGSVALLMTDFGIAPPTAMLGMLTTDPKVTVIVETVLSK